MIKTITFFSILLLLNTFSVVSQNNSDSYNRDFDVAEKIFSKVYQQGKNQSISYYKGEFSVARPLFIELYKQDSTNRNVAFKIGVCLLSSRNERPVAIKYFTKAIVSVTDNCKESSHKEKSAPLIAYKFLGDAYHLNYQFDKAIVAYEK